jgi:hypothetical protein
LTSVDDGGHSAHIKTTMSANILNIDGVPMSDQPKNAEGGFRALGVSGGKLAVFTNLDKHVYLLSPSDLKEMNMKALFGASWCSEHYDDFDEKKGEWVFNHRRLATAVIAACQAAGPYSETLERRVGVWKTSDGQLLINGRELWRPDGSVLEHGIHGCGL